MITALAFALKLEPNKYKLSPRKVCRYIGMLSAVVTTHRYDGIRAFPTICLFGYELSYILMLYSV
jgi:hypothetical protein